MNKGIVIFILVLSSIIFTGCADTQELQQKQEYINALELKNQLLEESLNNAQEYQVKYNLLEQEANKLNDTIALLKKDNADLTSKIDELEQDLAAKSLSPRHFYDRAELVNWRNMVGIIGTNMNYVDALIVLQQQALKDGFILSIDVDWDESIGYWGVSITAIAGEGFYQIFPDDLTVTYFAEVY